MSINVTVSGNPVRINRGKMVTAYDPTKKEFEKRRLMRLEQVRQQSKDIAENIRNKLKKEKTKCLSQIEKDGEVKIKNWQARKLLELQNQYQEALDDIGLGQKSATLVEEEEEIILEQDEENERIARERGRAAAERLQIQKNEESLRKAVPIQRKKITRDGENNRSSVMANSRKSSFKKKKKKKQVFDSDSENRVPKLIGIDETDSDSYSEEHPIRTEVPKTSKEQQTSPIDFQVPTRDEAAQTLIPEDPIPPQTAHTFDNRISEHIKRRTRLNPEVDYCNYVEKEYPKITFCECCKCPVKHQHGTNVEEIEKTEPTRKSSMNLRDERTEDSRTENGYKAPQNSEIGVSSKTSIQEPEKSIPQKSDTSLKSKTQTVPQRTVSKPKSDIPLNMTVPQRSVSKPKSDIPSKPKITLRSTKDRPVYIADPNAQSAQYYDHPNRYSKSYIPNSHIERIDEEELVISPNVLSEEEIREKMRQREREAHIRGQAALEKEKIQREYRDLMKKLPALQKQERICEIGMDKEKYHMSRDRLEELEKRRQNRLDNAYEELFVRPKPATVTLPRRKEDTQPQSLNLANWDVDFELQDPSNNRIAQLNQSLSQLKSQQSRLWKEIESSLSKETLAQLKKSSNDDVKSKSTDYTQIKTKRKRSLDDRPISPTSSDNMEQSTTTKTKSTKKGSLVSTGSPSPRKKPKMKSSKKILILQNTSTQTTPQIEQKSAATSPIVPPSEEPCICGKDPLDDLCEIVIKIKEDQKPEVVVNPPFLGSSVKVLTEDVEPSKKEPSKTNGSWREQLSQTTSRSTSSTSYFDPPNSGKSDKVSKSPHFEEIPKSMNSTGSSQDKKLDPRLLTYIKKLLNMSRASIDDLTVSSASEVSTPSHSVLETPTNNPLAQLANVMKYFNIDVADLQKQLSYTTDESGKHYNTTESLAVTTTSSEGEKSEQFKSCTEIQDNSVINSNQRIHQYANIAANCTKKISNLTAMIEKVRAEKKKIMESSGSSSEGNDLTTTSYKDLPDKKQESPPRDEMDKLLTIDYSYAEKLKQLSREEVQIEKKRQETDSELLNRLKQLLQNDNQRKPSKDSNDGRAVSEMTRAKLIQDSTGKPVAITTEKKSVQDDKSGRTEKTTVTLKTIPPSEKQDQPLFLDIPKLPRLEASLEKKKKKPPPTKALRAISGNAPHELSTIVEADSQMSTKIESPSSSVKSDVPDILSEVPRKDGKSNSTTTTSSDDVSEMETMETMLISIGMEWAIPTLKKTREALAMASSSSGSGSKGSGEVSLREFLSKISSSSSKSGENSSLLSDSQGMSLIQADNRRTSTPIVQPGEKKEGHLQFLSDSDISSVREHSKGKDSEEKFFDFSEGSAAKTG